LWAHIKEAATAGKVKIQDKDAAVYPMLGGEQLQILLAGGTGGGLKYAATWWAGQVTETVAGLLRTEAR